MMERDETQSDWWSNASLSYFKAEMLISKYYTVYMPKYVGQTQSKSVMENK